ncbi:hypothetical protein Anas_10745 [Armadillidium nasatum]|uniref:Uncharacterized protein n=1 Tax=Armadillidium nasatum TaxID=96803 RepID=A0A5N5TCN6_9CRUS|nr:hypothetical protein Anas_10745 [Armadillidium nasatum]
MKPLLEVIREEVQIRPQKNMVQKIISMVQIIGRPGPNSEYEKTKFNSLLLLVCGVDGVLRIDI